MKVKEREEMGPGITELLAAVKAQGIGPVGAWFNHGYEYSPARCRFEIGVTVSSPVAPVGRVVAGTRRGPGVRIERLGRRLAADEPARNPLHNAKRITVKNEIEVCVGVDEIKHAREQRPDKDRLPEFHFALPGEPVMARSWRRAQAGSGS